MVRLIDSSVFIAMERRGEGLEPLITFGEATFALASITASELMVGIERSTSPRQRQRRRVFVETILRDLPVIAFDLEIARIHARLFADLEGIGRLIGHNDLIIAATALARGYSVLTHNVRHFDRVQGLVVEVPNW